MKRHYRGSVTGLVIAALTLMQCGGATVTTDIADLIAPGMVPEKALHAPFRFLEGPIPDAQGNVYFNDVPAEQTWIYTIDGTLTLFRENTNRANGMMFNHNGELLVCEGGAGRMTAVDPESGEVLRVLVDSFEGHALNSPNDLALDARGGIYFTDPAFGQREDPLPNVEAVYYLAPGALEPIRVVDDVSKPNGVMVSLDGHTLYVVNSWSTTIRAYHIQHDGDPPSGRVEGGRDFAQLLLPEGQTVADQDNPSGGDGLGMDALGNLYVTSRAGVQVFNVRGERLGIIATPEIPANCAIGGAGNNTLFITARTSVYTVPLKVQGARLPIQ